MKYKIMKIICMFDLPTDTEDGKRNYRLFRKNLIKEGFIMIQYSVYVRTCPNRDYVKALVKRVSGFSPNEGNIRMITVTEKQYDDMKVLVGDRTLTETKIGNERLIII